MNKNNARILCFSLALILFSFSFLNIKKEPIIVQASDNEDTFVKVFLPIYTFFYVGGKIVSDKVTQGAIDLTENVRSAAKDWYGKLTTKQQQAIINKSKDPLANIDQYEYSELGIGKLIGSSNSISYTKPVATGFTPFDSTALCNTLISFAQKNNCRITFDSYKTFNNSNNNQQKYEFKVWANSGKIDSLFLKVWYNDFKFSSVEASHRDGFYPSFFLSADSCGSVADINVPVDLYTNIKGLNGVFDFNYSPVSSVPTSFNPSAIADIGTDVNSLKDMYASTSKYTVAMGEDINIIKDGTVATADSSAKSLEELKKSNGFLGTIKDFITITLPNTLSNIWEGIKTIPKAITDGFTITLPNALKGLWDDIKAIPRAIGDIIYNIFIPKRSFVDVKEILFQKIPINNLEIKSKFDMQPLDVTIPIINARLLLDYSMFNRFRGFLNAFVILVFSIFAYKKITSFGGAD